MSRLLLDTTFLIGVLNDRRGRADLMEQLVMAQHTLACCAVETAEVLGKVQLTATCRDWARMSFI